jgi:hypothetical protein
MMREAIMSRSKKQDMSYETAEAVMLTIPQTIPPNG